MPDLEDRSVDFDYGYRMHCECGSTSYITAANYHAGSTAHARMPCDHCDLMIHFGPAVAALRDPDDVALDNAHVHRLAWYHTGTSPDWPSPTYAAEQRTKLLAAARRFPSIEQSVIDRQTR